MSLLKRKTMLEDEYSLLSEMEMLHVYGGTGSPREVGTDCDGAGNYCTDVGKGCQNAGTHCSGSNKGSGAGNSSGPSNGSGNGSSSGNSNGSSSGSHSGIGNDNDGNTGIFCF